MAAIMHPLLINKLLFALMMFCVFIDTAKAQWTPSPAAYPPMILYKKGITSDDLNKLEMEEHTKRQGTKYELWQGSGVLVGGNKMLTDMHVVQACDIGYVVLPTGQRLPIRTEHIDPISDLALLSIPITGVVPPRLRQNIERGSTVHSFGFAGNAGGRLVHRSATLDRLLNHNNFRFNVGIVAGESGGPVFDESGNLVGLLYGGDEGTGYATNGEKISAFLQNAGIVLPTGQLSTPVDKIRLANFAATVVLKIECQRLHSDMQQASNRSKR